MIINYTGNRAEQVVKGVTKMVIKRSFQLSMFRVAIIEGIVHAVPEVHKNYATAFAEATGRQATSTSTSTSISISISAFSALKPTTSLLYLSGPPRLCEKQYR